MNRLNNILINADDYCLTDGINEAIVSLSKNGLINSVSVIVTNPFINYKEELDKLKHVKIGLHLNLNTGEPVSKAKTVSSLVDKHGYFYPFPIFWVRYILGLVKKKHISIELEAQYKKLSALVDIDHLDSHKHIHCYPFLGEFILRYFSTFNIPRLRNSTPIFVNNRGYWLFKIFCGRRKWKNAAQSYKMCKGIVSIQYVDDISVLYKFDNSDIELMVHPSTKIEGGYLNNKAEYQLLMKSIDE